MKDRRAVRIPLVLLLLACLALAACARTEEAASEAGLFKARLVMKGRPVKGANRAEVFITDAGGNPVAGAEIGIETEMAEMEHYVPFAPEVREKGGGLYEITFHFTMAGRWRLRLHIASDGQGDAVTFDFPDVKKA
ncbi:MAG: hypothetical protein Kow0025_03620 [Thermodesulfovibrionales bacterium]